MGLIKLKPSYKDYIWGGRRLIDEYGKDFDGDILAESWELSCHPDGPSTIVNGPYAGLTLQQYIDKAGREVLGTHCRRFRDFPILVKFIDARDNLSIQVHPDNRFALATEGQYGKTEMWYIMDAEPGAFLYYGFKEEISRLEFMRRIQENSLLEVLNAVPVHKGDIFFIEAGTIHAIGKGILLAEIQQNSNLTYRVYDYGRVGKDGKKRDLHIEKSLAVTSRTPAVPDKSNYPHVADCDYFTVDKLNLDGAVMKKMEGTVTDETFASVLVLDGCGVISCGGERLPLRKGDSFFLSAGSGVYTVEGRCDALVTTIREKSAPVRIGIDIGGTETKIGLVDVQQKLLAWESFPTQPQRPPREVIDQIGGKALALLDRQGISLDQCVGAGVGMPGTVDRDTGVVRYSNNIPWVDVPLAQLLGRHLPIPIRVANDADCAALGETVAGAGRECQDVVMLTLGTGVGGGIILDGEIYTGKGGSELGHMVIVEDGAACTCGRRGCLEAYASATALKQAARMETGQELSPQNIFRGAREGDPALRRVVDAYTRRLGIGLVNIVNIFRPQLVLLGGGLSGEGGVDLEPLRQMLREGCFGGEKGQIPALERAELGNRAGMIGAASLV